MRARLFWIAAALTVGAGAFGSGVVAQGGASRESAPATTTEVLPADDLATYESLDLFGEILERVEQDYVEQKDPEQLIEAAVRGMLESLDPHSSYLSPEEFDAMRAVTSGAFGGLGVEVTGEDGFVKVVAPYDDTPAARAGLRAGDLIVAVDGTSVEGLALDDAVAMMRGEIGNPVVLSIARADQEPFDVTLVRERIVVHAVKSSLEDKVVVLRVATFSEQTYPELEAELAKRVAEAGGIDAVEGFVLDLRNNPGGLLDQAAMVSDAFLEEGVIVTTRGRDGVELDRMTATAGDLARGKPMTVLINGGSASASEIVSGALKDQGRAIIVGAQSFGKGSVQSIIPIGDQGAIRMTIARYYTPSGRSIQGLGVTPDIVIGDAPTSPAATVAAVTPGGADAGLPAPKPIAEADLPGALANDMLDDAERKSFADEQAHAEAVTKRRAEDPQLAQALDALHVIHLAQPKK